MTHYVKFSISLWNFQKNPEFSHHIKNSGIHAEYPEFCLISNYLFNLFLNISFFNLN